MILYYGLTNYHLLCSIVHKFLYCNNEDAIFIASEGRLKNRIKKLKKSKIFKDIYYIEDKKLRDNLLNKPLICEEKINNKLLEKIAKKYISEYKNIFPYNLDNFKDLYILADHGALGLYLLMTNKRFHYIEDASGVYSKWKNLDRILNEKDKGMAIMCRHYNAYGKSNLIIDKYISFKHQFNNCKFNNCIDFEIDSLLNKLNCQQLKEILNIFDFRQYNIPKNNNKNALILTQRFTTFNLLSR